MTITGTNFTGATEVRFGQNVVTSFTIVSPTSIQVNAPAGDVGTVDVTVTTPSGTSPFSTADLFTYSFNSPTPVVKSIEPNSGPSSGGNSVFINGANFLGTVVRFGSTPAVFNVVNSNLIVAIVPPGSGTVSVSVTTSGGTGTLESAYVYVQDSVPSLPLPPTNAQCFQKKGQGCRKEVINVLTWDAPAFSLIPVVSYQIFRDPRLTELVATVPASNSHLIFEERASRKCGNTYFIVSVDQLGQISPSVEVKPKKKSYCCNHFFLNDS